jgi:hypothetical protein
LNLRRGGTVRNERCEGMYICYNLIFRVRFGWLMLILIIS